MLLELLALSADTTWTVEFEALVALSPACGKLVVEFEPFESFPIWLTVIDGTVVEVELAGVAAGTVLAGADEFCCFLTASAVADWAFSRAFTAAFSVACLATSCASTACSVACYYFNSASFKSLALALAASVAD